ncbi:MAG: phosphoribosyltransferase [Rectinemataceae bacterium]|nr:phosphoribosyltransferase [Spirochaetaceae bacterium]
MEKRHFTYQEIHRLARDIAFKVQASGFEPDVIVAIGSGGFIPARILRTYLGKPILAVGIAFYDLNDRPTDYPRKVQWIEEAEQHLAGRRILLVDEVDDSRITLEYCTRELLKHKPSALAVAVLHDKRKEKRGAFPAEVGPVFVGQELDDVWIVYPWDAKDIDEHDRLAEGK